MIIRRLAETLRRQHWDTVFVELGIVVVGIFLGIEAANWNEDRRDRQDESAYLLRLHEDVRSSIAEWSRNSKSSRVCWRNGCRSGIEQAWRV